MGHSWGLRLRVIAVALGAALPTAQVHAEQCQLLKVASYPITLATSGHLIVPFSINDTTQMMIVDTGGFIGELSSTVADSLNLRRQPLPINMVYTASGKTVVTLVTVPKIAIGPIEATNIDFLVADMSGFGDSRIGGVLAPNILKRFDIDFDFAHQQMNVFAQDHCPGRVVYWTNSGSISVPFRMDQSGHVKFTMQLDGQDIDATLDTGAPRTTISSPMAYRLFGLAPGSPDVEEVTFQTPDGPGKIYHHRFKTLSIDGVTINNPDIKLLPDEMGRASRLDNDSASMSPQNDSNFVHVPDMLLGANEIMQLHLYIAYGEKNIYVTARDAH